MRKNSVPSFIEKAWEMLQHQPNQHIVSWSNDGQSFRIIDEPLFSSELLPKYFKHSNFSSFIRQLNMYNFHKRKTSEGVQFYHQLFRKGQRQLLIGIRRKPSEAEILQGEELIRKLAPQCLKQNMDPEPENIIEEKPHNTMENNEIKVEENQPAFVFLNWNMNGCEFNRWSMEKKVKTTIIKTQNIMEMENRGF